jgi:hypothetical protein
MPGGDGIDNRKMITPVIIRATNAPSASQSPRLLRPAVRRSFSGWLALISGWLAGG